mmetsp:Transcript_35109/g.64112  ORF Transcript_35109/g.64112 Transcript_35109/m.64112 type:complete len:216 (+) Transcript_35109:233-880(+)
MQLMSRVLGTRSVSLSQPCCARWTTLRQTRCSALPQGWKCRPEQLLGMLSPLVPIPALSVGSSWLPWASRLENGRRGSPAFWVCLWMEMLKPASGMLTAPRSAASALEVPLVATSAGWVLHDPGTCSLGTAASLVCQLAWQAAFSKPARVCHLVCPAREPILPGPALLAALQLHSKGFGQHSPSSPASGRPFPIHQASPARRRHRLFWPRGRPSP